MSGPVHSLGCFEPVFLRALEDYLPRNPVVRTVSHQKQSASRVSTSSLDKPPLSLTRRVLDASRSVIIG